MGFDSNAKECLEKEKDAFTLFMAEVLHDAHYIKLVPPVSVVRETWRDSAPFTQELNNLVIYKSKMFIRMCSNTDLEFLRGLANWIAKYIAQYTQHSPKYSAIYNPNTNDAWQAARADLQAILFDDFDYIQKLAIKKQANVEKNKRTKENYHRRRRIAEGLGDGFVFRATANGEGFVPHTTQKGKKTIVPDDVATVRADLTRLYQRGKGSH